MTVFRGGTQLGLPAMIALGAVCCSACAASGPGEALTTDQESAGDSVSRSGVDASIEAVERAEEGEAAESMVAHSDTEASASAEVGAGPDESLVEPSVAPPPVDYVPQPGSCGLDAPAFCDDFEAGAFEAGRAGELNAQYWSGMRGMPVGHATLDEAFSVGPSWIGRCRDDLSNRAVGPDQDTLICDPTDTIATRHLLTAAAAQNYGLSSYRIRQPFDFEARRGRIVLDVDLTNQALGGWPAIVLSEEPTPAPSFNFPERGSGPRNGVAVEFYIGSCSMPNTVVPLVYSYHNYTEATPEITFDCALPYVESAPGALNHVELVVGEGVFEVWASDASPDGLTFPNFRRLHTQPLELGFERGYVNLVVRNHATIKYWKGGSWPVRWDNVGFDGPFIPPAREISVPNSGRESTWSDGCLFDGQCLWRGQLSSEHPEDETLCSQPCEFQVVGQSIGYVLPREDESAVSVQLPDVVVDGARSARLILAVDYPWFEWNGVFPPPTELGLRYRLNGNAWHERKITAAEARAFEGTPDEGPGAGLLNQLVEVDLSELRSGDNQLELTSSGTWTGSYRAAAVGIDLQLTP